MELHERLTAGRPDPLVVGGAEPAVFGIANHPETEFPFGHLSRAISGTVINHNHFERNPLLLPQRNEACAQKVPPVPVDDHDGNQPIMLTGPGYHLARSLPCGDISRCIMGLRG